jgi:hypothetical protein
MRFEQVALPKNIRRVIVKETQIGRYIQQARCP